MRTLSNRLTKLEDEEGNTEYFYVIHPLDDIPEEKVKSDHLPPLKMTPSVWWALFALRGYLLIMLVLLVYRLATLARV
ncbi:MAG: hypothetical protein JO308_07155 [Verrucomicrobia bacterium]|nr:hypothetical protein [Verrucomicrobiota bacterium]